MYDHFGDEGFISIARRAGEVIDDAGLGAQHVRAAIHSLEMISLHSLSIEDLEHFEALLTEATANILKNCAYELPFEDIEALDEALFTYGSDPDLARSAIHRALDTFIPDIDVEMEDYGSVDELDEFEKKLRSIISKRGYIGASPDRDLRYKRDELLEAEYGSRDDGYSARPIKRDEPWENSNEYIQSMFAGLATDRD
jgi:hypothetical protein